MVAERQQFGSKEEEEVRREILHCQKESCFPEELFEDQSEEVVEDGLGPCESVERASLRHFAYRKIDVEATDGGRSKQERICLVTSVPLGWKECG